MFTIILSVIVASIAALALYLISADKRDPNSREVITVHPLRSLTFLPFVIPFVVFLFETFTIVPAGHVGVQVTMGTVNPTPLSEGVHFVNPLSSVKNVEVRVVKADLKNANAGTKDLQVVHTDIVVNYRIDGTQASHMYKEFGLDLENKILLPAANESFKSITAQYTSEELVTKRADVSNSIHAALQSKVTKYGLTVSEISLVNFGFSAEYQKAIEQKVIATQQKHKAEQDLERIKVEAQSRIAEAEGEAKAIAIQAAAIQNQGGAQYVQLKAIEKWDGNLPNVMSGAMPFVNVGK
jgi:regulator of protease activity HflC (stomatin/prohibitin superfamily)